MSWESLFTEFEESAKEDLKLDPWQEQVLNHQGSVVLRAGRQVGKSTIIARKAGKLSMQHEDSVVLIIAAAQRQSGMIFSKVLGLLLRFNDFVIEKAGRYKEDGMKSHRQNQLDKKQYEKRWGIFDGMPTKTEIRIKKFCNQGKNQEDTGWTFFNRDEEYVIYSLPAGKTGAFIRGLTVDLRIADEAAYIPEEVWLATNPMMAVSRKKRGLGWDILLSTPFGKGGYFYQCCNDTDYKQWHISSELCPRFPADFLKKERDRLTKAEYAQEYLGEFVDEYNQFCPTELIKKCMTFMAWDINKDKNENAAYYLGIDPARYGEDEAAFVDGELHNKKFKIVDCEEKKHIQGKALTSLRDFVVARNERVKYRRIFNDDTGVGGGLTDMLQEKLGKSTVIGLNNASRKFQDEHEEKKRGILKEDLYSNALVMMERSAAQIDRGEVGELQIINNMKLIRSLKSVQFEYTQDRNLRIHGKYTHLAEAFVRCCWAMQSKGLRLFVA